MGLGCYFGNQGFFLFPLFSFIPPTPPSHRSKDNPWRKTHYDTVNRCLGIFLLQLLNERFQRRLLLWGSGICKDTNFQRVVHSKVESVVTK